MDIKKINGLTKNQAIDDLIEKSKETIKLIHEHGIVNKNLDKLYHIACSLQDALYANQELLINKAYD
jgi:hypothetical protein